MAADATTLLSSQITAAAACAYILNLIKQSDKIPWVTQNTQLINVAIRAVLAGGAALGISHVWAPATGGGGVLTITIPPLSVVVVGLWHWFGQYAFTHIAGNVLDKTNGVPAAQPIP